MGIFTLTFPPPPPQLRILHALLRGFAGGILLLYLPVVATDVDHLVLEGVVPGVPFGGKAAEEGAATPLVICK